MPFEKRGHIEGVTIAPSSPLHIYKIIPLLIRMRLETCVVCQLSRTLVQYLICYLTTCNGRSPRLHSIFISSLGTLPQHYFSVKANIYFDTDDLFLSELQKAQMQFSFLSLCFFTPTTCTEVHFIIIAVCGNYSKKLKQTNDM